ncbi:hypothetical protein BC830DRAFT_377982 [Chytriomyces sp. MP71]|nr:hypothetical protein BC830DRAFT_377982 [Chytriomyces sp. MP71]
MGHSKQHDEHKPSHQPKSEHPPEVLDLFVGQKPEVSQAHVPLYGAPKHNLSKDIPDNLHHLPHLTSTHANPAAQQHHQNQIQKQYQLQQAPPKVQYLQPLAQTISTNHHQMASDESMHQTQQATQRNDSDSSAISAKEANAQSRRRGANEKKAAEAVLARARRLQQIGGGGDIKRNPMLGHKVGRLHANGVVGVNDAARAENAVMFGVVGKIAPNNNATKFPVLSFAPPQSTMHTNIASNGQNNLPPLAHHDAELKPKHKFAQGHLPKESVLLPSLTDKNMLKLSVVPAVVEGTTSTNLPALRKKP